MFREVHYGGNALMWAAMVSGDWGFLFKTQSSPNSEGICEIHLSWRWQDCHLMQADKNPFLLYSF